MMKNMFEEALRYPFKDYKKVISLGVFYFINLILVSIAVVLIFNDLNNYYTNISYLTTNSAAISPLSLTTILIIGLLVIMMFIVNLFLMGYYYRIIDFSLKKLDTLPVFNEFGAMIKDGLKYFGVTFIYGLIIFIPALILGGMIAYFQYSGVSYDFTGTLNTIFDLIIYIIQFIVLLITTIAIPNMIKYGSVSKAFNLSEIKERINKIGLGRYILLILILDLFVMGIVFVIVYLIIGIPGLIFAIPSIAVIEADPMLGLTMLGILAFIMLTIITFLVEPYLAFFRNRTIGSIYNESE